MTDFKPGDHVAVTARAEDWPDVLELGTIHVVQDVDEWRGELFLKLDGTPSKWRAAGFTPMPKQVARTRDEVLTTAQQLISGDREQTYGSAIESFERIAQLWSVLLGIGVTASDVARCMVAMKLSRLQGNDEHRDSWVDIAGYAALGAEVAEA